MAKIAIIATLLVVFCSPAWADTPIYFQPNSVAFAPSASPSGGGGSAVAPYTAAQIRAVYGADSIKGGLGGNVTGDGSGQTIAIVTALHDPSAFSDLNVFSAELGLPQFNLSGGSSQIAGLPTFTQIATANPDGSSGFWTNETALDIEWAHAMAPKANIVLVEAPSPSNDDLYAGVNTAKALSGVSVVSMSWGGAEISTQTANDSVFTTPASKLAAKQGVTFVAASGDFGSPGHYPAYSPNVLAVGGTSLTIADSSNQRISEVAWGSSGGGVSSVYAKPSFQSGVATLAGTANRAMPDVSIVGDPTTGVYVYNTQPFNSTVGAWYQEGGTSLSAPLWAGLIADADQLRETFGLGTLDGPSQTLPGLYGLPAIDFTDIDTGSNGGYSAGVGYDAVTGLGAPNAALLVPDLSTVPEPTTVVLLSTALLFMAAIRLRLRRGR